MALCVAELGSFQSPPIEVPPSSMVVSSFQQMAFCVEKTMTHIKAITDIDRIAVVMMPMMTYKRRFLSCIQRSNMV